MNDVDFETVLKVTDWLRSFAARIADRDASVYAELKFDPIEAVKIARCIDEHFVTVKAGGFNIVASSAVRGDEVVLINEKFDQRNRTQAKNLTLIHRMNKLPVSASDCEMMLVAQGKLMADLVMDEFKKLKVKK